jgi:hypothetical protein
LHVRRRGIAEGTAVKGSTNLAIRVGDNLTGAADGKAVIQTAGTTPYREK